jgi:hypothetical protein
MTSPKILDLVGPVDRIRLGVLNSMRDALRSSGVQAEGLVGLTEDQDFPAKLVHGSMATLRPSFEDVVTLMSVLSVNLESAVPKVWCIDGSEERAAWAKRMMGAACDQVAASELGASVDDDSKLDVFIRLEALREAFSQPAVTSDETHD